MHFVCSQQVFNPTLVVFLLIVYFLTTSVFKGIIQCFCVSIEINFEHLIDVVFGYKSYLHDIAWLVQAPCDSNTRCLVVAKVPKVVASYARASIKSMLHQL